MKEYDVIVVGSGGGAKIVSPAASIGQKVAIIEKDAFGGTCLNRGCIPSKMFIHPADLMEQIREATKFEIGHDPLFNPNFAALAERISQTVDKQSAGIAPAYEKNPNIDVYKAQARFIGNKLIAADGQVLTADKIFIATGARPHIPNIPGLADTPYMTSTEALRATQLPKKLIVIGAGYIAVELGHVYGAFGSQVHFIVRSGLIRHADTDLQKEFSEQFSKRHTIHYGTPESVSHQNGEFSVTYQTKDGQSLTLKADALLIATGVTPNSDNLALEKTDITTDSAGYIQVSDTLETKAKNVYAMGDVVGNYLFRHSVNFEGEYLFDRLYVNKSETPIKYSPVPYAVFTHPQIAGVGATEQELQAKGVEYISAINPYKKSAMGMARLSEYGFVKVLFERNSKKLLGAHLIGEEAATMAHMFILGITMGATLDDLLEMIYIHPALPEVARNACRIARSKLITV